MKNTSIPPPPLPVRALSGLLALGITVVCAAMAGAAAAERATTEADRLMVTATAVALVVGAHLLPALSRRSRWMQWLFVGCIVATLYNHAHFFAGAQHRAGTQRATAVSASGHALALQTELAAITARPLAVVAAELAQTTSRNASAQAVLLRCEGTTPGRCTAATVAVTASVAKLSALKTESTESAHAADLRSQLASAASALDAARTDASADPVDVQIAHITGLSVGTVGLLSSLLQSLLLELLGAALWALALPRAAVTSPSTALVVTPVPSVQAVPANHATPAHSISAAPQAQAMRPKEKARERWRRYHSNLSIFLGTLEALGAPKHG